LLLVLTLLTRRELLPRLLELLLPAVLLVGVLVAVLGLLLVRRPVLRELAGLDRRGTVSPGGGLRRVRVLGRLRGRSGHGDFLLLDLGHNRTPHPTHA
jgi:hypothetical protein